MKGNTIKEITVNNKYLLHKENIGGLSVYVVKLLYKPLPPITLYHPLS